MRPVSSLRFAVAFLGCLLAATPGQPQAAGTGTLEQSDVTMNSNVPDVPPGPVPHRTMLCRLSRATNIDPTRNQSEQEIVYEGNYSLTVDLPAVNVPEVAGAGTGQNDRTPNPGYHVTDPDLLFRDFPAAGFDRVADYWPKHVELGQTTVGKIFQFIILDAIPDQPGTTSIFISRAADAISVDMGWVFRGQCQLAAGNS